MDLAWSVLEIHSGEGPAGGHVSSGQGRTCVRPDFEQQANYYASSMYIVSRQPSLRHANVSPDKRSKPEEGVLVFEEAASPDDVHQTRWAAFDGTVDWQAGMVPPPAVRPSGLAASRIDGAGVRHLRSVTDRPRRLRPNRPRLGRRNEPRRERSHPHPPAKPLCRTGRSGRRRWR